MNLSEFLLARIAEDEATVVAVLRDRPNWDVEDSSVIDATPGAGDHLYVAYARGGYISRHIARWDPARVLAECQFKRRIVRLWDETEEGTYGDQGPSVAAEAAYALAAVYADHPDYDPSWRP